MRLRPELNWPYVIFCILVLFLMCGAIAYFATFGPAAGKSPAVILLMRIGVDALCLGTVLFFVIQFRHDSQLDLDDDGISKPTMFGMRVLRWTEIREVRFVGPEIWLVGPDTRIAIHPFAYADPSAFMPEIESRLRHLLPQQPGKSEEQSASRGRRPGSAWSSSRYWPCTCFSRGFKRSSMPRSSRAEKLPLQSTLHEGEPQSTIAV